MSATTGRGYPYPQSTDTFDPAADMQALAEAVDADIDDVLDAPFVRLVQQSAQSYANNTAAAIQFGTSSEERDSHNFHSESSNNTRITPSVAGWYEFTATYAMQSATYTQLLVVVRKNGSNVDPLILIRPDAAGGAAGSVVQVTTQGSANGSTDYFEAVGQQNSSGTQSTIATAGLRSTFSCKYLGPL